jgi:2-polyprenyl-6-methoxyphenol hydroxylase-like FAD-dependent oxidoreductase
VRAANVVVLGGGPAGLFSTLALARAGHPVTLVERDEVGIDEPLESPTWPRKGVAHFLQPHAFIPRGREELLGGFPDLHPMLLAAGAHDVDLRPKCPSPAEPGDEALQFVAVRRPLIEWALRRAVAAEPLVTHRYGARATGLRVQRGRVAGVELEGGQLPADVVVDAMGRRSPRAQWLEREGVLTPPPETSDCGVVYYSRYYRLRPGCELRDGPFLLSPRGDLGYAAYASFPGDNGTFATLLAVPSGAPEWRALKDAPVFEAATAQVAALRAWVDDGGAEPITDVLPMAGLRNSITAPDAPVVGGLFPVGDAFCHTDPVLAHGLSFAAIHARSLAAALGDSGDPVDAVERYLADVTPWARERFRLATDLDEQRFRMWTGQPVDPTRRDGDYELFALAAGSAVALVDAEVFRVVVRRVGLLDSTRVLDDDIGLQRRIEARFAELIAKGRPTSAPKDEFLGVALAAG